MCLIKCVSGQVGPATMKQKLVGEEVMNDAAYETNEDVRGASKFS